MLMLYVLIKSAVVWWLACYSRFSRSWVQIRNLSSYHFFPLQIEETCTFINISNLIKSCKCDIKAGNSSTLCKFHEERKGLRLMGSNTDPV